MFDVVGIGEALIDFTYYGVSEDGNALFEQNAGGAIANVIAMCGGLGLKTAFIGKVGADMHGAFLRDVFQSKNVDVSGLITDKGVFTTLAFVKLAGSERSFSFARKPGADTRIRADELDIGRLKSTRILHFGSLSLTDEPGRTATLEAIKIAKAAGVLISYDPNYRAMLWPSEQAATERMRSVVGFVDVIKISDEETVLMTGENDPEKAAKVLLNNGVQCAVVTLGAKGALAAVSGGIIQKLPPPCKPVDTTGAGDAFWGAFLYKLIQSGKAPAALSMDEISDHIVFANTAASISVEKRGGIPSLPALSAVLHRLGQ